MGLSDMLARAQAAQGMVGGGGGGAGAPADMGMPSPDEAAPPQPPDLESALAGVESAVEGMDPKMGDEIRTHLNAIREIASQSDEGQAEQPLDTGEANMPIEPPPTVDEGQMPK